MAEADNKPDSKPDSKPEGPNSKPEAPAANAKNAGVLTAEDRPPGDLRRRTRKEQRQGPFVKFVGAAAIRRINATQWRELGLQNLAKVGDGEDAKVREHSWDVSNDKMLEERLFSDEQLDYLLIDDLQQGIGTHAFLLVDYEGEGDDAQLVQVAYE